MNRQNFHDVLGCMLRSVHGVYTACGRLLGLRICLFNGIPERSIDLFVDFLRSFESEFARQ